MVLEVMKFSVLEVIGLPLRALGIFGGFVQPLHVCSSENSGFC